MLLHLVKFLHWFIVVQWIDKPSSVENWKFILMAYCVILFALIAYESTCRGRIGRPSKPTRYFLLWGARATVSVGVVPIAIFILSLIQPCMPPLISSVMFLSCPSWGDDGGSGFLIRSAVDLFEWYTWTIITSNVAFALMILLLYPVEIKLLFISMMARNWKADKSIGLEEYRTLRLLSNFHNFVFAYPAMAILVGGVTLCTSIAFYLLITSAHVVPLPVLILFSIIAFDFFFAVHESKNVSLKSEVDADKFSAAAAPVFGYFSAASAARRGVAMLKE
ncbi:hypothetical protein Fcan01_23173 [Folsomia candida]|uniref:Uncharacterized protein n=1 Tax=Folsomia candida TaxID=158441 RepID=A0A226DBC9_FOLCA|nr:hypothetical protein Fcan01_23173 [Folsomia candida]